MTRWMKLAALAALFALGAAPLHAASSQVILASSFDLDGEAADDDQVVAAATIANDTSYTVLANPDVCRLVDVTITDANSSISVGTVTIIGTDCWGYPLSATYAMAGGSGARTGSVVATDSAHVVRASGAYFKTITTVTDATVTGEGGAGDTIKVGYTANSANSFPMYGKYTETSSRRGVDVFGRYDVPVLVTTGATSVDVKALSASTTEPFQNVSVGDILVFNVAGEVYQRRVVTRTDADNVVINGELALPTAGINFSYRKFFFLADPIDGWIPVSAFNTVSFLVQVDANADTGGVTSLIECGNRGTEGTHAAVDDVYSVDTSNVATSSTGTDLTVIDLWLAPNYNVCRVGLKFGTGDDTDSADENIDIVFGAR